MKNKSNLYEKENFKKQKDSESKRKREEGEEKHEIKKEEIRST